MTDTLDLIQQGIDAMFDPTDIVEVRVPKAGKFGTIAGYFEASSPELAKAIQKLSGQHDGIYVTLNPCKPALLSRAKNRVKTRMQLTTSDHDITQRIHLLVDIDPVRPAGVSSTNEELEHARLLTRVVYKHLKALDWAEPLIAESGNGFHLVYNISLPNDKDAADLVKAVLKALAAQFDNEFAKVDTSVFNAARIVKAYGSLAAKGDSTEERPHRIARVVRASAGIVTIEQLQALAPVVQQVESATESNSYSGSTVEIDDEKMEEFLAVHGLEHHGLADGTIKGQSKWVLENCPFNADHTGKDAAVFLTDGKPGFRCLHNSCTENHWQQFRAHVEELSGKKFYFGGGDGKPYTGKVLVGVWNEAEAKLQADLVALKEVPPFPPECLEGSLIGDIALAVTKESFTEPVFAYNNIKTVIGALVDGFIGYPNQPALHTRMYTMNVSAEPQCGKGYSRQMTYGADDNGTPGPLTPLLTTNWPQIGMLSMENGNEFGSGEKLVSHLAEGAGRRFVFTYDEMNQFFERGKRTGSVLDSVLLELYGNTTVAYSTMKMELKAKNVRVNFAGDFTVNGFRKAFEGTASIGNGLLSRCVLAFAGKKPYGGDGQATYPVESIAFCQTLKEIIQTLVPEGSEFPEIWKPEEEPEAKALRLDYTNKLMADEDQRQFSDRIIDHMKRDLLLRVLFSNDGDQVITPIQVERAIQWAEYQLACRRKLWQAEGQDPVACMNLKIMAVLRKHKDHQIGLSDAQLCTLCNIYRDGTQHIFERAIKSLTHGTSDVEIVGRNHMGRKVYALKAS